VLLPPSLLPPTLLALLCVTHMMLLLSEPPPELENLGILLTNATLLLVYLVLRSAGFCMLGARLEAGGVWGLCCSIPSDCSVVVLMISFGSAAGALLSALLSCFCCFCC
jgi:hypothetical protein